MTKFEEYVRLRWGGVFPKSTRWIIAVMGLAGETGECVEPMKKHLRDGKHPGDALKLELGDLLHYLTVLAHSYNWTLEDLMEANMQKLDARDAAKRAAGAEVRP